MSTSRAIPPARDRSTARLIGVGGFGALLALIAGASAATSRGELVAGAIVGLACCGIAVAVYARDPVLALIGLWVIEVFNSPLSAAVGENSSAGELIRQADEVFVLLLLGLTAWRTVLTTTRRPPLGFILPAVGVALFGILGATLHGVPWTVSLVGAWLGLKLWIMVGITVLLPWKPGDLTRVYTVLTRVGLFLAALGLVDYLTHGAVSDALHTSTTSFNSESFRGEAVHSIFPRPGEFSLLMSLLFALTFARFAANRRSNDLVRALVFAGSIVLSLRLKGFLSLAAITIIVALVQTMAANRGGASVLLVGALLLVGVYSVEGNVVAKQIAVYTSSASSARARLYTTGQRIAADDFPLGVGFGRFASYPSRIYYSPVYRQYELSSTYGLSQSYPNFIDDTSWPSVIGETGYGGFVLYVAGIVLVIVAICRRLRVATATRKWAPLAALCAIVALLVDSFGDPTLFDWVATTTFAMILGPALVPARFAPDAFAASETANELESCE